VRPELPSGTVTFLFTDVEGSTRLLHELGGEGYAVALARHRRIVREAVARQGGVEVDTQGDAFFVVFPTAPGALAAAREMTEGLAEGPIKVRIGIHTGTPLLAEEGYVGADVNRAARIGAAGHGGQVLVSAATASLTGADGLRDLGAHRLKDLSAPERIYQLGERDFPPLTTLHQTNLPIPATPFLGREHELAEVVGLLSAKSGRLLTLTGAGGSGKTRLALQAAGAVAERYPHGVFWVPLAPLRDPALVLESASRALAAEDGLAEHIADKRLLLLFDNFEHLLEAAGELSGLLARCPSLELLVTSREPLRLAAERSYPVPPFAHQEAVGFFAARAGAAKPDFEMDETVSVICGRLDDLPLALELAAARVKALSTRQILERLEQRLPLLSGGARDAPERQRTLRATIEWSYELLAPEEQRLFSRLAVFRGGCTLEAAEAVCAADLDTLQSLVEKSLSRFSNERYWMLETIREYATEQLAASGEAAELARRHADWLVRLAEDAYPNLRGSPKEWLDRLEAEHDNLRAALDTLEATGATQTALQLAGALARFWGMRGHITEGARRLEALLDADERPTRERARALNGCAMLQREAGDLERAGSRLEEALALHRALGDEWGATYATYVSGLNAADRGDFRTARPYLDTALRGFQALEDDHYVLLALDARAWLYGELGDHERRREAHEQVLHEARRLGDEGVLALTLHQLASIARQEGRHRDELAMLTESLQIYRALAEPSGIAAALGEFSHALARRGDPRTAAKLVAASDTIQKNIGSVVPWMSAINEQALAAIRADLDEDAIAEAWQEGAQLTIDDAVDLAFDSSVERK
jgi:predicted ATPase